MRALLVWKLDVDIGMLYFPKGIILPKPITVKNYHVNNVIDVFLIFETSMYTFCVWKKIVTYLKSKLFGEYFDINTTRFFCAQKIVGY